MNAITRIPTPVVSGSYDPKDVTFLLQRLNIEPTPVQEKERLIQTGQKHYSEMISREEAPARVQSSAYRFALQTHGQRLAAEVASLAAAIGTYYPTGPLVLVSLVRAGVPLGVLLNRAIKANGRLSYHYGISIIRDRGLDMAALNEIIDSHGSENIVFVDGWTGKGAIANELSASLADDPRFPYGPRLVVLSDMCGKAWMAASSEDWVIPFGILGATVSGLISRTIWPGNEGAMHGCITYNHLAPQDQSNDFVDTVDAIRERLPKQDPALPWLNDEREAIQQRSLHAVEQIARVHGIDNLNRVKPGIAEATRAVLRRVPERVLVSNLEDPDVRLLRHLTNRMGIRVEEVGNVIAPYRAMTIICKAD